MTYLRLARRRQPVLKTVLLWALVIIPLSALLYGTSAKVRKLENELASVNASIAFEKQSLGVLRAEWAYLNQPQRLSSRAHKYLGLNKPAQPLQVAALPQISQRIALRPAPEAVVASGIAIAPPQARTPSMLAQPIVFNGGTELSALHADNNVKLPSSSTWTQKVVSAIGLSAEFLANRSRAAP